MTKQHLVVVRAGDNSLHPHWLAGDGDRTWDPSSATMATILTYSRSMTWCVSTARGRNGRRSMRSSRYTRILSKDYDYIWLPDDDVMASKADINRLFTAFVPMSSLGRLEGGATNIVSVYCLYGRG